MVGNIVTNEFHGSIPKTWNNILQYDKLPTSQHFEDGWRDVISPAYNLSTQYLGQRYYDESNNVYTYYVLDKTEEQIQNEIISQTEQQGEQKVNQILKEKILIEAQNDYTDEDALANIELYPFWKPDTFYTLVPPTRLLHFNNENELVLYKVNQDHTSQSGWLPKDRPALYTRVALPDEVLEWVQPTGTHDAYQIGDRVLFGGQVWICTVENNVWQPGVYGWELE